MSPSPRLIWLPKAVEDLERLYHFLHLHNREAASRASLRIVEAVQKLSVFPKIGKAVRIEGRQAIRELYIPFGQNGYWLRYALTATEIIIVRIWHGREDR